MDKENCTFGSMVRATAFQKREARDPKSRFDPESLTKAELVKIVRRAMEHPEDFPLWMRREMSSAESLDSLDREMRSQIELIFGDRDYETDASGLIASMEDAVESGKADANQALVWVLEALDLAEDTILHQHENDFTIQCDIDMLGGLAVKFLQNSAHEGRELAEAMITLSDREFASPITELRGFATRLGKEGLVTLRSALERQPYPDRSLLVQIYELQKDELAWIELQVSSPKEEDQIAALKKIQATRSSREAIERATDLLNDRRDCSSPRISVRRWWYQERCRLGEDPAAMSQDAWMVFEKNPCSPDAWNLLQDWAGRAGNWGAVRSRGLAFLESREKGNGLDNFRHSRIRIARDEGRERDAWEIARLGVSPREMEEAILRALPHWPREALIEFDRLVEGAMKTLSSTNNQGFYQVFTDLLRKGKQPFGTLWLANWKSKVNATFPRRPKLLEMVANV